MAQKLFTIFTIVLNVIFCVSCGNSSLYEFADEPSPTEAQPVDYEPVSDDEVLVNMSDGSKEPAHHSWALMAEDTIRVQGSYPMDPVENLSKGAENNMFFMYAYDKTNRLRVEGIAMSYKGRTIYPKNMKNLVVLGSREVVEEIASPFWEISLTHYRLQYNDLVLAKADQVFVVDEGYVPSFESVKWTYEHSSFVREASRNNNVISVFCENIAKFAELWDDQSLHNEENVPYQVVNKFNVISSEINVDKESDLIGKTFTFNNGIAAVSAYSNVKVEWASADVKDNVMYKGINYKDSIAPCKVFAKTITFNSKSEATVRFYDSEANDYAEAKININVKVNPAFKKVVWSYKHGSFRKDATLSNNVITVLCDNEALFYSLWDDNSKHDSLKVDYTIANKFTFSASEIKVDDKSVVVGKTFNFSNGAVTVAGASIKAVWSSASVQNNIVYRNKNYKDSVNLCKPVAKTINFVNANQAVITFYENSSKDYAQVTVPVTVTENAKLDGYVKIAENHLEWNSVNSTSNGFYVTCNNNVVIQEKMTDGTMGQKFTLPYVSNNTWSVSGTSFTVNDLASVLNHKYTISNGVSVSVDGNTISFNKSMTAEKVTKGNFSYQPTPCEAVAKFITIVSSTKAVVEIYHGNDFVGEANLTVNVKETEKPQGETLEGRIVGGWATDAYVNGSNVATWEGCYYNILVENDGVYKLYTRNVASSSKAWSVRNVSASYAKRLNASEPACLQGSTAETYAAGSCYWEQQSGNWYKIVYLTENGSIARVISDVSYTIGGESSNNCRKPLRGTWNDGVLETVDGKKLIVNGTK